MGKLCVYYFCFITTVLCVYSPEKETEIRSETVLNSTYDAISRPSEVTRVAVGVNILSIDELDLPAQRFVAAGWITLEWEDERLLWDPATKDNISRISSAPSTVWKPEVIIDNALDDVSIIADDNLLLTIESNGTVATVEWEPPRLFTVHCEVDITYYPYDQQKCGIEIVSWGFTTNEVVLEHIYTGVNLEDYRENGEWEVTKTDVTSSVITETRNGVTRSHSQLDFWVYLKRRDQFYNTNIMLPMVLSSILVMLVFTVPVESGEKLSYILTVLLTIAVFLTIIGDTLPAISLTTSVLGIYVAATTVVAGVATLITVWILYIHHKTDDPPPVGSVLYTLSCGIGKLCRLDAINNSVTKVEPADVVDTEGRKQTVATQDEPLSWERIALIWDKFCLIIFVIVTILLNFIFILVLAVGGAYSSKS